ncbi:MAG: PilZ domain-containing protein [Bacteriovoracia bacterium]
MFGNDLPGKPKAKKRAPRAKIPLQRVTAEVKLESNKKILPSRVFLTDLNPQGVGFFSTEAIEKGELVSIVIEQPRHLFVKGEVIWCKPYTLDTKILSEDSYTWRVGVVFDLKTKEEQESIKKYCEEISPKKK